MDSIPSYCNNPESIDIPSMIQNLTKLEVGWDSYDAETPNQTAVDNALKVYKKIKNTTLTLKRVSASVDNGVSFTFTNGDRHGYVECANTGELAAVVGSLNRAEPAGIEAWEFTEDTIVETLTRIEQYLNKK